MDRFAKLVKAISAYDNEKAGMKSTSHHSAVSVRVTEMEAAVGNLTLENEIDQTRRRDEPSSAE